MKNKRIAVAGSILVDIINSVEKYPNAGELSKISAISKSVGGCVPNVAIDLKKISPELDIVAVGLIGDDDNGKFVKKTLNENGIDISSVKTLSDGITSSTQVISVDGGQRTFFTYSGASSHFGADDVELEKLNADMLHLGYFLLLDKIDNGDGLSLLKKASQAGLKTSIDLVSENSDRYKMVKPCLGYVDNLIINELEGSRITGIDLDNGSITDIAEKLIELGVRERAIIHYPEGAVCASRDGNISALGSYILDKNYIMGTTGAGDAFCAGALVAIANDLSDEEILKYGSACAAMALRTHDAVSGVVNINSALSICSNFSRRKIF